ncbi:vancomycin high temperature exclusion protein [Oryzobacter terrae]|uniref:SanA/YdcF family protein n=1 Tax=Oryzobacter terrae TaxID=1620385 RepID=UPI00366FBDED
MAAPRRLRRAPATPPRRARGWGRRVRSVAAVLVLAGLVLGAGPWLWTRAASSGHVFRAGDAPSAPVVLVLGAGLTADGAPSPYLAGRLDVAAELVGSGRAQVVLVSGDNRYTTYDEPTAMQEYLVARGIPPERVVRDFAGRDTYDSCVRARRVFGVDRLLVVSQAHHLPRAVAICRAVGLDADGVGDWTGERYRTEWRRGAVREVPASVKAVLDVVSGRDPVLGPAESGVRDALTAS